MRYLRATLRKPTHEDLLVIYRLANRAAGVNRFVHTVAGENKKAALPLIVINIKYSRSGDFAKRNNKKRVDW